MKFFSWMKSKIHGKDNTIKPEPESPSYHPCKEDTTGCSSTLLSIGTFGNNVEHSEEADSEEISADHLENTAAVQEFESRMHEMSGPALEFEKELRSLLNEHASISSGESERFDLPIEKMLESFRVHEEEEGSELGSEKAGKDIPSCSRSKSSMYKKSISFLLRKAFVCGGGFAPAPILRDPFLETNLDRSRMEKILKAVLRKKKQPQRQKFLEENRTTNEEERGEGSSANNWVKTDSEYIFLDL